MGSLSYAINSIRKFNKPKTWTLEAICDWYLPFLLRVYTFLLNRDQFFVPSKILICYETKASIETQR